MMVKRYSSHEYKKIKHLIDQSPVPSNRLFNHLLPVGAGGYTEMMPASTGIILVCMFSAGNSRSGRSDLSG